MLINEPEQINDLTLEELESDEVFNLIQDWANIFKESARFDSDAVQLRRALEAKLNLPEADEELKTRYETIVLVCRFSGLIFFDDYTRGELIKNQLIEALKNNIDVKSYLDDFFIASNDILSDHLERRKIIQALRENKELLGNQALPDWLTRFAAFVPAGKRSGTLERLNFLNNNPETKKLNKEEKDLLLKILELLDFLEYPDEEKLKADWDVLVADKDEGTKRMKMAEFLAMKKEGVNKTKLVPIEQVETVAVKPVKNVTTPVLRPKEEVKDAKQAYIINNKLTPSRCASYLKAQFPEPTDFKKVLKILNELNRQGHPEYMEIVYFDETDLKFHWKEY